MKLRVSADTKRHLLGNVLKFPLGGDDGNVGEGTLTLDQNVSLDESLAPARFEQAGLAAERAWRLSAVLKRGLGDWLWNAVILTCNYENLVSMITHENEANVFSVSTLGSGDLRVHISIRFGDVELVALSIGMPNESFLLPAKWCFPGIGVTVGVDPKVMCVCQVNDDGSVLVQSETGAEKFVALSKCHPARGHKLRDRVMIIGGKYAGRFAKVVLIVDELVQLQLEDDARVERRPFCFCFRDSDVSNPSFWLLFR